jgi:xylitol oxidase
MRQDVFEDLPLADFLRRFDDITALGDSVSSFVDWRSPVIQQVWLKRRIPLGDGEAFPGPLRGAVPATNDLHPIAGLDASNCTPQMGLPGPWHERLPHFRMAHTPSSGEELQSEYFVDREDAPAAFEALWAIREQFGSLVQVSEVRTIAADALWLSPASGRPTAAFHFTWLPDQPAVEAALRIVEGAIAPFEPRAHWAKLSTLEGDAALATYPFAADFETLRRRLDPDGKLGNPWMERSFGP